MPGFYRSHAPALIVIQKSSQADKSRHFGRDAENQAMVGNQQVVQVLDSGNMPYRSFMFAVAGASVVAPSLPSLDAGFRHPCRKDGPPTLVYNDERRAWERYKDRTGFTGKTGFSCDM